MSLNNVFTPDACLSMEDLAVVVSDAVTNAPNLQLPSPELLELYKNRANRLIWIGTDITEDTLTAVKRIMEYNLQDKDIPAEDRKPIKIFLDTPGGSVAVMWSIVQAIKISKTPVWTINFCDAMSAGAHILAAGHKRLALPGSTVLVHSGSCQYGGTVEQVESSKKFYDNLSKKADEALFENTKITKQILKKKAPGDWYLDTDEALEYGIIDKVVEDFTELL